MEIRDGIAGLPPGKPKRTLRSGFEDELLPLFLGRVLPFDESATETYAELRARARSNGIPIGDFGALIAAIAKHDGYTDALGSRLDSIQPLRSA